MDNSKYTNGEVSQVTVGEFVDGEFFIKIDNDNLNAYLTCLPAMGGCEVTPETILKEARDGGVSIDIDMKAVERAISESGENVLIASGKAAVDGADSTFESLVQEMKEHVPQINEEGIADFRNLGGILVVHKGDPLMRRLPAGLGEPGLLLSGQPLPAKVGKMIDFSVDLEGAEIHPEDKDLLIAKIDGCPRIVENGVRVDPVYTIRNVDLHSGNIDFLGTVNVTGDVKSGMTIKADGDIHIRGSVVGVVLIAKGDVAVMGGIIGHNERTDSAHAINARVECNGSCSAKFTQNARITAGKSIYIRDFTMMSKLVAAEEVIVGDDSHTGQIIGGFTTAGLLIQGGIIGSPTRSRTVVATRTSDILLARMGSISESMDNAKAKFNKINKLLDLATMKPGRVSENNIEMAKLEIAKIEAEIERIKEEEADLKKDILVSRGAHITAKKRFLDGVEVKIGPKGAKITSDKERGTYRLKDDDLKYD